MAVLSFALSSESVSKLYDALVCLGRFNETVCIEATKDHLTLYALNSTQSAYAAFTLDGNMFFSRYVYSPPRVHGQHPKEKFSSKIYNKPLLSVFKGRTNDPQREKDTGIEKCEVAVEDGAGEVESRFVIKMTCRNGVLKTYRLTFESTISQHALFNTELAKNRWSISSKTLREFVEHFGPKTEQLDIYSEEGRVTFVSYTEKIVAGSEILKQPLHTSVAIDTLEFTDFNVEDKLHVVISVKDFKSIVLHAGINKTIVSAAYSQPSKPMQVKYADNGMSTEFILMTLGDFRGSSTTPAPGSVRSSSAKAVARQPLEASTNRHGANPAASMPPPSRFAAPSIVRENPRARIRRPSPPPPQPSLQSESLFFPDPDDDARWDPAGYDDEDEEPLGWDASADKDGSKMTLSRTNPRTGSESQNVNGSSGENLSRSTQRLAPTQRLSVVRGIFDD